MINIITKTIHLTGNFFRLMCKKISDAKGGVTMSTTIKQLVVRMATLAIACSTGYAIGCIGNMICKKIEA